MPPRDCLDGTPYRSMEILGRGAMGRVVAAEHRLLKRQVCVKLIEDALASDASMLDRFRIEAQTLATLADGTHPHLLHVQDYGVTPAGQPYLVMERLRGRSLQDERKLRGRLPWREAVSYVLQALDGLAVAHDASIVHRDVKPANLYLCDATEREPRRRIKVLDFGIAKVLHADGPVAPGSVPTAAGMMLGTPRYASPEQLSAQPVDPRADVYGVALVLYELLSGELPFANCTTLEDVCLAQVLETLPSVAPAVEATVAAELDAIIRRGAAKDPAQRYDNARAMQEALRAVVARADGAMDEQLTTPFARPVVGPAVAAKAASPTVKLAQKGSTVPLGQPTAPSAARALDDSGLAAEVARTLPGLVKRPSQGPTVWQFGIVAVCSALVLSLLGWWMLHLFWGPRG
jgi:serine/threonine-protein kinase